MLKFLLSGLLAVAVDYCVYRLLLFFAVEPSVAKATSFIAGTLVSYFMGRLFTFGSSKQIHIEASQFALLYALTFLLNVGVHRLAYEKLMFSAAISFLIATGASTIVNFLGQKFWVFKLSASDSPATRFDRRY